MKVKLIARYISVLVCIHATVFYTVCSAQAPRNITASGIVVDDEGGAPLEGVTVKTVGGDSYVQTNRSGEFRIVVPIGSSLLFSFVGFEEMTRSVDKETPLTIRLSKIDNLLNEVIVTGYKSQRRKDITGSIAIVNMKETKAIPAGSVVNALQGQAAGVNITNTSGQPGAGAKVLIRGITSFGDTDPLVLVDGVQSNISEINASDIESIQVLKDAGAAAVYGVRGSNGVILITTNKGRMGAPTLQYESFVGVQLPLERNPLNLMNSREFAQINYQVNPSTQLFVNGELPIMYMAAERFPELRRKEILKWIHPIPIGLSQSR